MMWGRQACESWRACAAIQVRQVGSVAVGVLGRGLAGFKTRESCAGYTQLQLTFNLKQFKYLKSKTLKSHLHIYLHQKKFQNIYVKKYIKLNHEIINLPNFRVNTVKGFLSL